MDFAVGKEYTKFKVEFGVGGESTKCMQLLERKGPKSIIVILRPNGRAWISLQSPGSCTFLLNGGDNPGLDFVPPKGICSSLLQGNHLGKSKIRRKKDLLKLK